MSPISARGFIAWLASVSIGIAASYIPRSPWARATLAFACTFLAAWAIHEFRGRRGTVRRKP